MSLELWGIEYKFDIHHVVLLFSLLLSFINWKRTPSKVLWSSFLIICCLFEPFVNIYFQVNYKNNAPSNNVYIIIVIIFYLEFFKDSFYDLFKTTADKIQLIFLTMSITYIFLTDIWILHVGPYLIGLIFTTILIGFYLFDLIINSRTLREIIYIPRFWLGSMIILFTSINFPFFFHIEEIRYSQSIAKPLYGIIQMSNIGLSLSYLMCSLCLMRSKLY